MNGTIRQECHLTAALILTLGLFGPSLAVVSAPVDHETTISKHDFVWSNMPPSRETGAFIGNGMLGASIWAGKGETLRWELGRNDVYTTGNAVGSRLLIGKLQLHLTGTPTASTMHKALYTAEVSAHITTDRGSVSCRSIIPYDRMVGLVEFETQGAETVAVDFQQLPFMLPGSLRDAIGEMGPKLIDGWKRHPVRDFSDPLYEPIIEELKKDPKAFIHPKSQRGSLDGINWLVQPCKEGGGFVVAWGLKATGNGRSLLAYTLTPARTGRPDHTTSVRLVRDALKEGFQAQLERHEEWWKSFYSRSYVSVPDESVEGYYWRQLYKLGSATRADGVVLDELGPWPGASSWVRVWNNLNIQIAYLCPLTANRLELCRPFIELMNGNRENLHRAVPEKWRANGALALGRMQDIHGRTGWSKEFGNLLWALHDYWLYCRYSGDDELLSDRFYPLLDGAVAFLVNALEEGEDGLYHLPPDISPEYPGGPVADSNYNTALLTWGLKMVQFLNQDLEKNDPDADRWREASQKLAPLAIDETGLMVGSDRPFAEGHRHYSHLLAFFPLCILDPESHDGAALFQKSVDHWASFWPKGQNFFSVSGEAAMRAWLRDGEGAAKVLDYGIPNKLTPNTHFAGAGVAIESALCGMWSVGEMLLQSWTFDPSDYRIRVFPAIPESWKDCRFEKLRAEGAFLVSAEKRNGAVQSVQIFSEAGKPCRVENPFPGKYGVSGDRAFTTEIERLESGREIIRIDLKKGETVQLIAR